MVCCNAVRSGITRLHGMIFILAYVIGHNGHFVAVFFCGKNINLRQSGNWVRFWYEFGTNGVIEFIM